MYEPGREKSATGGRIQGLLGSHARRMRCQRVRASGTGLGRRPRGEPPVAWADGKASLPGMSRAFGAHQDWRARFWR